MNCFIAHLLYFIKSKVKIQEEPEVLVFSMFNPEHQTGNTALIVHFNSSFSGLSFNRDFHENIVEL